MRIWWHRCSVILFVLLLGCGRLVPSGHQVIDPSALQAGAFELDQDHAALLWKVDHFGFSTFVGRFNEFDASLDFDPEQPETSSLDVIVEMASIDSGIGMLDELLRGPDWFDTDRFPQARFTSTDITVTGEDSATMTGDLTLVGVTNPITIDIIFNGGADNFVTGRYTLGFAASSKFRRSEFGIDTLIPAVGDEVTLELHVEFLEIAN